VIGLRALFTGWLLALVAAPILAVVYRALVEGPTAWASVFQDGALDAIWLSLWTGALAAGVNAVMGTAIAWWLVRWQLPGRAWIAGMVDLPLAIPTLVAGLVLVALYGPQCPLGAVLEAMGIQIAFARPGIVLALLFVTLPFVVRAVEPVLREIDPTEEEAAATLGAGRWRTWRTVVLPAILPAIAAGAVQTFARSIAEFGSIAAVSGNMPGRTLTAPVYVLGEVEAGNPGGAASVSAILLLLALALNPIGRVVVRAAGGLRG
jgi:sulfate transport system permease protein